MILQNALKITQGDEVTYIQSTHRHDFVPFHLYDGTDIAIDGGTDYQRYVGNINHPAITDYSLDADSTMREIRDKLLWGTNGKSGKEKTHYLPISTLSKEHLDAIIRTQHHIEKLHLAVIKYWAKEKGNDLF